MSYLQPLKDSEARDWVTQRTLHVARRRPCVYFIGTGSGTARLVKIGKCTGHPRARLAQLQTGCPTRLRLLVFTMGGTKFERELHRVFAEYRVSARSEWFRLEGELLEYLRDMIDIVRQGNAAQARLRERLKEMVDALPARGVA